MKHVHYVSKSLRTGQSSRRTRRLAVVTVLAGITGALLLAGVGLGSTKASLPPVKIGAFVYTQGDLKTFGDQTLEGIKLAVDQINAAGGILGGRKVQLNVYDEGLNAAQTTSSVDQAKSDGVVGIVGFADATSGTVAASISNRLNLPIVIAGSGSGSFVQHNTRQDLVHVLVYPEAYVPGEAAWVKKEGFKSIAQVAYNSSYSLIDEAAWRRALKGTGISFPATVYVPYGQSDVTQAVAKALSTHPQAVIFDVWGTADIGGQKELQQLGFDTSGHVIQSDVSMVNSDEVAAGSASCGFADTEQFFPTPSNPASEAFVAALKKDQPNAVLGGQTETFYEGAMILLKGIAAAGTTSNTTAIGKAMRNVHFMTPRGVPLQILPDGQVYTPAWYMVSWNCKTHTRQLFQTFKLTKADFNPANIISHP